MTRYKNLRLPILTILFILITSGCQTKEDPAGTSKELTDESLLNGTYTLAGANIVTMKDGKNEQAGGVYYEVRSTALYDVTGDSKIDGIVLIKTKTNNGFSYDLVIVDDDSGKAKQAVISQISENIEVTGMTFDSVYIALEVESPKSGSKEKRIYVVSGNSLVWTNKPEETNFRCTGTEPFWSIIIKDKTIRFMSPEYEENWPYTAPVISGDTWVYKSIDGKKRNVTIKISKGQCSDGMSETIYDYKADIKLGTISINGCAKVITEGEIEETFMVVFF